MSVFPDLFCRGASQRKGGVKYELSSIFTFSTINEQHVKRKINKKMCKQEMYLLRDVCSSFRF